MNRWKQLLEAWECWKKNRLSVFILYKQQKKCNEGSENWAFALKVGPGYSNNTNPEEPSYFSLMEVVISVVKAVILSMIHMHKYEFEIK